MRKTITRRGFLAGTAASTALLACRAAQKAPIVQTRVPLVTHGVQVGDVGGGSAIVWARCNEPARMIVEVSASAAYRDPRAFAAPVVGPDTDHAGAVTIEGLEPGQTMSYRVKFEREADRGASAWTTGTFATPRADKVRFVWTGDTCGQGFGRNPEFGGLRGYQTMREAQPAFFLHSGDLFYADNPILAVWLTADVHYAAHHAFDPARATSADFTPFHEFVAGPIHAGTFGPNALDPTFGPELKFQWAPPTGTGNLAPWDGIQSFGAVDVTDKALRIAIIGIDGRERYAVDLPSFN